MNYKDNKKCHNLQISTLSRKKLIRKRLKKAGASHAIDGEMHLFDELVLHQPESQTHAPISGGMVLMRRYSTLAAFLRAFDFEVGASSSFSSRRSISWRLLSTMRYCR